MSKRWSLAEDRRLRAKYPHMQTKKLLPLFPGRTATGLYQRAQTMGLHKTSEYLATPEAGRLRGQVGSVHRFQKGLVPWNLGKTGYMGANRTSFGKGNYSKRWDKEIYCVGALRVNADGGLDIKVREGLRAWDSFARFVWESERGPIPPGGVIRFRNGDTHDTRIANLRLGTKADVMLENTYHRYPKELARLIQLRGALQRQINKRDHGQHR